jgi:zinc transporter, ZIP family
MIEAGLIGLIAASSLVVGAVLALKTTVSKRAQGWILAFGAGALLGAVAYELFDDAVAADTGGLVVAGGFALGAIAFFGGSIAIDHMERSPASTSSSTSTPDEAARSSGLSVVLGAVLDGIPESVVLGMSLIGGALGVPMFVAVFVSNVPEALSASEDLHEGGMATSQILRMWTLVAVASAIAAAIGFVVLQDAPAGPVAGIQAFAAGAILAMLAGSMIPEAHDLGGRPVALATCLGFAVSAGLSLSA